MNGRELKKGDEFCVVKSVDLAVSLFTLGVPFYDPATPYIYQMIGGKRQVRFVVEMKSKITGMPSTTKLMSQWQGAEDVASWEEEPALMVVAKRVIWERRFCLCEVNHNVAPDLQTVANHTYTTDLRQAVIAYALGYERPEQWFIRNGDGDIAYAVGKQPVWLYKSGLLPDGFHSLVKLMGDGMAYIEREDKQLCPIATAMATYLNISAWLEHLRTDKPFLNFTTASGKAYWVKEGSTRWKELLEMGYSPA